MADTGGAGALRLAPLRPPLARPPGPGEAVTYDPAARQVLVTRVTSPPPVLPPSSLAAVGHLSGGGGGGGGGAGAASLLPSPRPTPAAEPAPASAPTTSVEAYSLEASGGADAPVRAAPAGAGPPAAWVAAAAARPAAGGPAWLLALGGRAPSSTQVLACGAGAAAHPKMFVHAPADRRAGRILGGFWVEAGGGGGSGGGRRAAPTTTPPRLALVTAAGLDVAALTPRLDGTLPAGRGPASPSLGGTAVRWWAWNPDARLCVLGTGGGGGGAGGGEEGDEGAWVVAYSFSAGDGCSLARLPPAALAGEGGAVLHVGGGQAPLLAVVGGSGSAAATLLRCGRAGLARVGSLPPPPGGPAPPPPPRSKAPLLVACVDGLLVRLAPGCREAVVAEAVGGGGGGAVAVVPVSGPRPPGWDENDDGGGGGGADGRWSLSPDGVLLDAATGAAWAVEVDGAGAAAALGGGSAVGAAAFFARRPGGGPAAAARTAAAVVATLRAPTTVTAADLRDLASALVATGLAPVPPDGALPPAAVVGLLAREAGGGSGATAPPARLAAAAASFAAALHGTPRGWDALDAHAAATLNGLVAGPPDLLGGGGGRGGGSPSPLAVAAVAARALPPPPVPVRVAAALAARAPLRALRAAGHSLDRGTAGAIAAVAVERVAAAEAGGGGGAAALAAAQLAAESVHAAAGAAVWREEGE